MLRHAPRRGPRSRVPPRGNRTARHDAALSPRGDRSASHDAALSPDAAAIDAAMAQRDVFILATSFNPFLYAAVAAAVPASASGGAPVGAYMAFWALALFAVGPLLDQALLTRTFMRAALVRAHRTEVPDEQVRALWAVLAADTSRGGSGTYAPRPTPDASVARLTRAGTASFTRLVRHARALQTGDTGNDSVGAGDRPGSPSHPRGDAATLDALTARELRAAVAARRRSTDPGGGGEEEEAPAISYTQFASFFRATGGMIDLNTAPRGGGAS